MERKLDEINEKLSKMLTKSKKSFIKEIISTIDEMKDKILSTVTKRIDILESEMHKRSVEADKYEAKLKEKNEHLEKLKDENSKLTARLRSEDSSRERENNDLEQYGRRDNICLTGVLGDSEKQASNFVISEIVKLLNQKTDQTLEEKDIDIAHILGHWEHGKTTPVIARLVRRHTNVDIMKHAKDLSEKKVFINEDLRWLNEAVLSSLRLKDPEYVMR